MPMTLPPDDADTAALRAWAGRQGVSIQAVVHTAVRECIQRRGRAELIDHVLDRELPRYAEALERLGR